MLQDSNLKDEQFLTLFLMTIYSGEYRNESRIQKDFQNEDMRFVL